LSDSNLDFAETFDIPVPYMTRLRDYYLALGYGNPYRWAQFRDVPFTMLKKPLNECRVGLVTTAAPLKNEAGDQGAHAPYNAAAKFYSVYAGDSKDVGFLGISHLGYDRKYSTAEDVNAYFPLEALNAAAERGEIGDVSPRFYGTPTNRSQVTTLDQDCVDVLNLMIEDKVDAAVIAAN
jgi:D-proline reductase (dithiol) PrdB